MGTNKGDINETAVGAVSQEDFDYTPPEVEQEVVSASPKKTANMAIFGSVLIFLALGGYFYLSSNSKPEVVMEDMPTQQQQGQVQPSAMPDMVEPATLHQENQPEFADGQMPATPASSAPANAVTPTQNPLPSPTPISGAGDLNERLAALEGKYDSANLKLDDHTVRIEKIEKTLDNLANKPAVYSKPKKPMANPSTLGGKSAKQIVAENNARAEKLAKSKHDNLAKASAEVNHQDVKASEDVKITAIDVVDTPKAEPIKAKPKAKPTLTALVPGRAFIQIDDARLDVAVGDNVPNCGKVSNIDADKWEVSTETCIIK